MCAAVYRYRHLVKAMEVTAGLAESNGSLLPGLWRDSLHVTCLYTCGLTACTPGSAPGPTLGNEYGKTLPFTFTVTKLLVFGWTRCVVPIRGCTGTTVTTNSLHLHARTCFSPETTLCRFKCGVDSGGRCAVPQRIGRH